MKNLISILTVGLALVTSGASCGEPVDTLTPMWKATLSDAEREFELKGLTQAQPRNDSQGGSARYWGVVGSRPRGKLSGRQRFETVEIQANKVQLISELTISTEPGGSTSPTAVTAMAAAADGGTWISVLDTSGGSWLLRTDDSGHQVQEANRRLPDNVLLIHLVDEDDQSILGLGTRTGYAYALRFDDTGSPQWEWIGQSEEHRPDALIDAALLTDGTVIVVGQIGGLGADATQWIGHIGTDGNVLAEYRTPGRARGIGLGNAGRLGLLSDVGPQAKVQLEILDSDLRPVHSTHLGEVPLRPVKVPPRLAVASSSGYAVLRVRPGAGLDIAWISSDGEQVVPNKLHAPLAHSDIVWNDAVVSVEDEMVVGATVLTVDRQHMEQRQVVHFFGFSRIW